MKAVYFPLRAKFMILFCLLITIPFLVIGMITYKKYSAGVERNTSELTYQLVDQMNVGLDRYVKEIERLTLMPLYDDSIMRILKNHRENVSESPYLTSDETSKMNLFISSLSFDRSEIESIAIYTNDGSIFSNLDQSVNTRWREPEGYAWMDAVREEDGGLVIVPPHVSDYYVVPKSVISIARVIREPYTNKTLGMIKVDLTTQGFESILSSASLAGSGRIVITDREARLIFANAGAGAEEYRSAGDEVSGTDAGGSKSGAEAAHGGVPGDTFISASTESDYTGLRVTAMMPLRELRKEARELSEFTLIVSVIALAAACALAILSAGRLVKPIAHLHAKMRQVKRGQFQERAVVSSNDEIGQLTEGFNAMIGEIDRLVKEVYETRLRERESELSALQSQIHPHFLYNTLEMMNMLALQGNGGQLSVIATSLGKLLRYTVDNKERRVFLQDELRFVESYLQIQALRLGDALRVSVRVDSSYDRCIVPKLLLQPLVENVIEHAMGAAPVHLRISARVDGDDLIVTVQDDGMGMSPERKARLEREMNEPEQARAAEGNPQGSFGRVQKGFALRNVHQRIRLLHGEPHGITIDQSAEGVTFDIRLPIEWGN
jgi:two-component system sensor histidine kinase YesM